MPKNSTVAGFLIPTTLKLKYVLMCRRTADALQYFHASNYSN